MPLFPPNPPPPTPLYTLSLHDALPISPPAPQLTILLAAGTGATANARATEGYVRTGRRSEEHTSELQSRLHLVCRLLLEKKKTATRGRTVQDSSRRLGP